MYPMDLCCLPWRGGILDQGSHGMCVLEASPRRVHDLASIAKKVEKELCSG